MIYPGVTSYLVSMNSAWKLSRKIALLIATLTLTACQTTGTLWSGSGSSLSSAQLLAALDGGLIRQINSVALSSADQRQALVAEYRALETAAPGALVSWQADNQALAGQVSASQPYRVGSQDCRQYSHRVFTTQVGASASSPASAQGTACRNPDGSWTLLS
ncbi:MAG: hypothetical protein AAFR27_06285 [Pseudomonadota bacterium]